MGRRGVEKKKMDGEGDIKNLRAFVSVSKRIERLKLVGEKP